MAFDALHDALEVLLTPQLRYEIDDLLSRQQPTVPKVLKRFRRLLINAKSRALLFFSNILHGRWREEAESIRFKVWTRPLNSVFWLGKRFELAPSVFDRILLLNKIFFGQILGLSLFCTALGTLL